MVQLDSINYTASSEYSPRTRSITHLQIHHATTTSLVGLRALMAPGGRTVSANGAMGNDGHLMGVVPESMRAFTSATSFDNNSYTIEVCNTSLSPTWGISDACHWRLARVAVDLHKQYGMPLDRAHIIGHREVPGTYATACPGPSMDLDRIVRYAHQLLAGTPTKTDPFKIARESENSMYVRLDPAKHTAAESKVVYEIWRNPATGKREMFVLTSKNDAAGAANLAVPFDATTLYRLGQDLGYVFNQSDPKVLTAAAEATE